MGGGGGRFRVLFWSNLLNWKDLNFKHFVGREAPGPPTGKRLGQFTSRTPFSKILYPPQVFVTTLVYLKMSWTMINVVTSDIFFFFLFLNIIISLYHRGKTEYQAIEEGRRQPRTEPRIVRYNSNSIVYWHLEGALLKFAINSCDVKNTKKKNVNSEVYSNCTFIYLAGLLADDTQEGMMMVRWLYFDITLLALKPNQQV